MGDIPSGASQWVQGPSAGPPGPCAETACSRCGCSASQLPTPGHLGRHTVLGICTSLSSSCKCVNTVDLLCATFSVETASDGLHAGTAVCTYLKFHTRSRRDWYSPTGELCMNCSTAAARLCAWLLPCSSSCPGSSRRYRWNQDLFASAVHNISLENWRLLASGVHK